MRSIRTVVSILAILSACTGEPERGAAVRETGGTLVVAAPSDLQALNSLVNGDAFTQEILNQGLFLTLLRFDEQFEYEPYLAESWTWAGDTAVTMRLRPGVLWSDGVPTTARDVAFTLDRARDPATASPQFELVADWLMATVIDSLTVRFLVRPHADALATWALLAIMPAHALDSIPSERLATASFNRAPVTNGPFRLVSAQSNDRWILEANPVFPESLGGRARLDRFVWRVIPENTAQVAEIETANADLILSPRAEQLAALDAHPDLRSIVRPSRRYVFIGWNALRPPLDALDVRRALAHALNRPVMLAGLRAGLGTLATGPIAPHHWAYDSTVAPLPYDPASARMLLDRAGLRDRDGDGMREGIDGRPWSIELKIAAGNAFNRDLAELVRSDLASIGVRVETRPTDFATLIDDISSPDRRFDAVVMGWEADVRLALRDLFHSQSIGGPFQLASYANPVVDSLLDVAEDLRDHANARAVWADVQRQLLHDQPWTFLWYAPDLYVAREGIAGMPMDLRGTFTRLAEWSIAEPPTAAR